MQEKIDFSRVPSVYPVCLNRECTLAKTCLRQIAEQNVPVELERLVIINPKAAIVLDGICQHYRSARKVRYAKGFIKMLEELPHGRMRAAISQLMSYFGRTHYYRVRKGERLLSPADQKKVLNTLKKCGVSDLLEFDDYVEEYDW